MKQEPRDDPLAKVYFGGQAVLEGVMIRGPHHMAVAVRHPGGHIVQHAERLSSLYTGRARRIPLLRGALILWETLALGMRALSFSSRIAMAVPPESTQAGGSSGEPVDATPDDAASRTDAEFPESVFWGTMAVALAFVIGLFFAAPILLANLLETFFDAPRAVVVLAEGLLRLGLFVGYLVLIGLMSDIRRVFQYHGAEHMTIAAWEANQPLTVESVRRYPKEHTRCGTSFLLVVVGVSLIAFFVFDLLVDEGYLVRLASRMVLIVPIAALSYEILRLGARFGGHATVRALFRPNIALQALTTRRPDDDQIEVAIASFRAVLVEAGAEPPDAAVEAALQAAPALD